MHLGNARTALLAWLQAREAGGAYILRLEDLDTGRVRAGAADTILRDLAWLGLDWDEGWDVGGPHAPYRQTERQHLYAAAAARLETYPCTCSRLEVLQAASAPHGAEPRYPGTCRAGPTHPERRAALRLRVPDLETCVTDGLNGLVCECVADRVGDFVVQRNDGAWAYQLACVVDDFDMRVTDVVRGADLLPSTPRQALLCDLLGYSRPRHWHVPLMHDYHGERLAKRHGAPSLRQLREGGHDPQVLVRDLAQSLGWAVTAPCTPKDLLGQWSAWLEEHRHVSSIVV
jgi:glutamyl-tRNA synthetase